MTVKDNMEQRTDTKDAGAMAMVIQQVWNATWVYTGNERRAKVMLRMREVMNGGIGIRCHPNGCGDPPTSVCRGRLRVAWCAPCLERTGRVGWMVEIGVEVRGRRIGDACDSSGGGCFEPGRAEGERGSRVEWMGEELIDESH